LVYISPEKTLPFGDSYPISHVFLTIKLYNWRDSNKCKNIPKKESPGDLNCCSSGDEGILSAKISVHKNGGYVLTYISCIWEMALFSGKTQWENPPTPPKKSPKLHWYPVFERPLRDEMVGRVEDLAPQ